MHMHNDQFGQRVHLDPRSSAGQKLMHSIADGWMSSCSSGQGWGTPINGQSIGRAGLELADDGNTIVG
eukprot:11530350-Karenia_brevis.AAC.1